MMHRGQVMVDVERCTGCGKCVRVCPDKTLVLQEQEGGKRARAITDTCLGCGHCQAMCPEDAVRVTFADEWATAWANFQSDESWLPPGEYATGELVRLMRSRRSCRNFMDKAVPLDLLEDLVRIGVTAPSGTNCQLWTFTLLPTRERVMTLSDKIKDFFRDLNKKAEMSWLRNALALVGQPDLKNYYYEYYASVRGAIEAWEERGEDRLFYSAPAAILVGMRPGASCPAEDAMLATQNLLLGAHALGLGTCLIGYAVEAMRHTPRIKDAVNIPRKEPVYAVIALGWPAWPEEAYQRVTSRRKPLVRI